jgi:hypothetical protein
VRVVGNRIAWGQTVTSIERQVKKFKLDPVGRIMSHQRLCKEGSNMIRAVSKED